MVKSFSEFHKMIDIFWSMTCSSLYMYISMLNHIIMFSPASMLSNSSACQPESLKAILLYISQKVAAFDLALLPSLSARGILLEIATI